MVEINDKRVDSKPRRPRGRPRVWSKEVVAALTKQLPEMRSERQKRKVVYRTLALEVLGADARFRWLCDPQAMRDGKVNSWRPELLAELGQIADEARMKEFALELCQRQPTAKQGVRLIRRWRRGAPPGNAIHLARQLIACTDAYVASHQVGVSDVLYALQLAIGALKSANGLEPKEEEWE